MNKLIQYFTGKYLAAWVVLVSDAVLVYISYIFGTILRYNFELDNIDADWMLVHAFVSMALYATVFSISKTSSAVLRHSGLNDLIKLVRSGFIACAILVVIAAILLYGYQYRGFWLMPKSILIIQFLLVCFLLSFSRLIAKAAYSAFLRNNSDLKTSIMIFGAGESGRITCQTLMAGRINQRALTSVVCFVDDNKALQKKSLEGLPIYSVDKALNQDFITKNGITQVIISVPRLESQRKSEITDLCLKFGLEIKEVPPYDQWIHGELSLRQIQPIRIENLLGRGEISLDSKNVSRELSNKTILITGAAGSIGSELARQSLYFNPRMVLAFDQAESGLFDLEVSLKSEFDSSLQNFRAIVGDINDEKKISNVFEEFKPDLVFHAAAYKHVPMMELDPYEAIRTNIFGTKTVADLSNKFSADKFVLVSTDKAINPTNVMGATKRASEMYLQVLNKQTTHTNFIITRFGNVLGSSGSVIPLFRKQIQKGGPITLTHRDITRYFMTISEACNLVLEAGSLGSDGEIYVFDMGQPVKIYDLAKRMIQLSGLRTDKDIKIETIGLRPGEKLFEEVLAGEENILPTHHSKIMKAVVKEIDANHFKSQIDQLEVQFSVSNVINSVQLLKDMVPEFISNNSEFEELDKKRKKLA